MKIIAVLGQKGGCGKTTISECLAVAAELDSKSAAILDMDPQGTAKSWKARRGADDPAVIPATTSTLTEELERVRNAGGDFVFIDTPARLSDWAMDAARVADLVIVPSRPTTKDVERIEASVKLATVYDPRPVFVVLTQTRPRGENDIADAEEFCRGKAFPICPAHIGFRIAYDNADRIGRTPLETEPTGKAAQEIMSLYRHTVKMVNHQTVKEESRGQKNKPDRRSNRAAATG